tara:strand:+ start:11044 stop:18066 length:7023 start_codon:yes stop_codon:yes gene_type:complete
MRSNFSQSLFFTFLVVLLSLGNASASLNFKPDTYKVFYGDINNDGFKDIYLHVDPRFLIIAADINIPIPLPTEFQSFALYGISGGYYQDPVSINPLSNLNNLIQLETYLGMFVQGQNELFIRASGLNGVSVVLNGLSVGSPTIAAQFDNIDGVDFSKGSNEVLSVGDFNGDGWSDLRRTDKGFSDIVALNESGTFNKVTDTLPTYRDPNYDTPTGVPTAASLVGITPAKLSVDNNGGANFNVPIEVPPSINGLRPSLSLNYNSNQGNGIAGQGWGLAGLSEIARCPSNIAQDEGLTDTVDLDNNDRYCLDGKRLLEVPDYTLDWSDSTYRTEIDDSYSLIKSYDSVQRFVSRYYDGYVGEAFDYDDYEWILEPGYFIVTTKSGQTMKYSAVQVGDKERHFKWLLTRVYDLNGNYYTVNYEEDNENGDFRIQSIEYGYHDLLNTTTALAKVEFKYLDRPDNQIKYIAGLKTRNMKYLKSIKTYVKESSIFKEVRSYTLNYVSSGVGDLSKLQNIQECDSDSKCLPPLLFGWQEESIGVYAESTTSFKTRMSQEKIAGSTDKTRMKFGDFNGDGLTDIFYMPADGGPTNNFIYLSDQNGGFTKHTTPYQTDNRMDWTYGGTPNIGLSRIILGDFDGNGLTDVYRIMPYSSTGYDKIEYSFLDEEGDFYSTSADTSFTSSISGKWGCYCDGPPPAVGETADIRRFHFGDFNGDGLTDIIKPQGFNSAQPMKVYLAIPGIDNLGQFNEITSNLDIYYVNVNNGFDKVLFDSSRFRTGDFNGDGLTDFYKVTGWGNISEKDDIYLSRGDGRFIKANNSNLETKIRQQSAGNYDAPNFDISRIQFGDFNSDGKTDIFIFGSEGSSIHTIWFSKGDGSFEEKLADFPNPITLSSVTKDAALDLSRLKLVDFNGDGRTDIYRVIGSGSSERDEIYLSNGDGSFIKQTTNFSTQVSAANKDASFDLARIKFADFNGDGLKDVYWTNGGSDSEQAVETDTIHLSSGTSGNRINNFINSLGVESQVTYAPLTDDSIYSRGYESVYPLQTILPSMYVAQSSTVPDGSSAGSFRTQTYNYSGLKRDLTGRGFQGFASRSSVDSKTGIKNVSVFEQGFPLTGRLISNSQLLPDSPCASENCSNTYSLSKIISSTTLNWNGEIAPPVTSFWDAEQLGVYRAYLASSVETNNLLNDSLAISGTITKVKTIDEIDNFGNVTMSALTVNDGVNVFSEVTETAYEHSRLLNKISSQTITRSAPNVPDLVNHTTYSYDSDDKYWQVAVKRIEPEHEDGSVRLITKFDYDDYGNLIEEVTCDDTVTEEVCSATDNKSNYIKYNYTVNGLFIDNIVNALGHTEHFDYDPMFGSLKTYTDINDLETRTDFDSLGREVVTYYPDSTETRIKRSWCGINSQCPTVGGNPGYYRVTSQTSGQSPSTQYYDRYGRVIRRDSLGFDGSFINIDTEYDQFGRVERQSEPYFAGDTIYWNTQVFDVLGRTQERKFYDSEGAEQTLLSNYNGFTTESIDALNHSTSVTVDALGRVITSTDAKTKSVSYVYDAAGNLLTTQVDGQHTVTMTYDDLGRKRSLLDPDLGKWEYEYYKNGNIKEQISMRSLKDEDLPDITTSFSYDRIGRMNLRTETNDLSGLDTSNWVYDSAVGKGKGSLASQKHIESGKEHIKSYKYDNYGRHIDTFYSTDNNAFTSNMAQTYDELGRLKSLIYPTGFKVNHSYNTNGYLTKVQRDDETKPLWEAHTLNARGQLEAAVLGNDVVDMKVYSPSNGALSDSVVVSPEGTDYHNLTYTYTASGNVYTRTDNIQTLVETFGYDELNRLTSISTTGGNATYPVQSYTYDDFGNIETKDGVSGVYEYGSCNAGPHAVCKAGSKKYDYDVVGSLNKVTNLVSGQTVAIDYTPFNKPKKIGTTQFAYGADRFRVKQEFVDQNGQNAKTYYLGNGAEGGTLFERTITNNTQVVNKHYVYAGSAEPIAVYTQGDGIIPGTEYYHRDALGSVVAVTDQNGQLLTTASFDAFGLRRNIDQTAANDPSALPRIKGNEGYTGHEELPDLGLIHMNGRVYDPEIGRFLSADPNIPDPLSTQSYNRYSYVQNNPLNFIDPSGFAGLRVDDGSTFNTDGSVDIDYGFGTQNVTFDQYQSGQGVITYDTFNAAQGQAFSNFDASVGITGLGESSNFTQSTGFSGYLESSWNSATSESLGQGLLRLFEAIPEGGAALKLGASVLAIRNIAKVTDYSSELAVSANAARRHLRRSLGVGEGQAHHIVAWESRTHPLIQKAAKGGFNINGAENGIRLGSNQHLGSHPKYNNAIISKLNRLHEANPRMSSTEAASAINGYINQLRTGLIRSSSKLR